MLFCIEGNDSLSQKLTYTRIKMKKMSCVNAEEGKWEEGGGGREDNR